MILDDPSAPNSSRVSALILATPPPKDAMRSWPQRKKRKLPAEKKNGQNNDFTWETFWAKLFFWFLLGKSEVQFLKENRVVLSLVFCFLFLNLIFVKREQALGQK